MCVWCIGSTKGYPLINVQFMRLCGAIIIYKKQERRQSACSFELLSPKLIATESNPVKKIVHQKPPVVIMLRQFPKPVKFKPVINYALNCRNGLVNVCMYNEGILASDKYSYCSKSCFWVSFTVQKPLG